MVSAPAEALTAHDVAEDEAFLALVEQALVRVAHERLSDPAVTDAELDRPDHAPLLLRFSSWVAVYARSFRPIAASALLARDDVPDMPWDVRWLHAATTAQWPTLARAAAGAGLVPARRGS